MEIFKPGIRINFLKLSRPLIALSALLVIGSWVSVATIGLNLGIDFDGGSEAVLEFSDPIDVGTLKKQMAEANLDAPEVVKFGIGDADKGKYFLRTRTVSLLTDEERVKVRNSVVTALGEPTSWNDKSEMGNVILVDYAESQDKQKLKDAAVAAGLFGADDVEVVPATMGSDTSFRISLPGVRAKIQNKLRELYPADKAVVFCGKHLAKDNQPIINGCHDKDAKLEEGQLWAAKDGISKFEAVGSAVGRQMRNQGILAVIYALIGILLYVSFRFDLRYSPGAVLALIHDVSITVGLYSVLQYEFSLPIIAALLAIVGYSLNDTIVVYDRIRESLQHGVGKNMVESINISVSDCLSRTVLTSVTTFIAVFCIWWFGGGIIQNFAFAMLVGVVIGTYSSIYIASPAVLFMDETIKERAEEAKARAMARNGA